MSLFQIISIASVTIILSLIAGRLFVLVRPKLTVATTVLFTAFLCLGLWCYFGALTNYAEGALANRTQLLLRDISYNGLLISAGMVFFLGALGLIILVAEHAIRRLTANKERITNNGLDV